MEIAESARRHGIRDADIRHAVENPIRMIYVDDLTMLIGGDRTGRLLEVGIATIDDEDIVVHAMPARAKYLR